MIKLNNLSTDLKHVTVEYLDIVNYEIARENICGYIFLLSRISQNAEPTEKMQMESKIEDLIYYRDNLQIEDKENIQKCRTHQKNADGKQNTGLNLLSR